MVIVVVRFKTGLAEDEVIRRAKSHMDKFASLKGLVQKYYVKDLQTGEFGGVYLWDSKEAAQQFQQSDVMPRILNEFQLQGQPKIEVLEVGWTLHLDERVREMA